MGTRGLVGLKFNNKYFGIANTFDSDPSSLGKAVKSFIDKVNNLKRWKEFKENLSKINFIDSKYQHMPSITFGSNGFTSWDTNTISGPRDLEDGEFLESILNDKLNNCYNEISFTKESLFCEYAYILNLDTNEFECYIGKQTEPAKNNPFGIEQYIETTIKGRKYKNGYYPIKLYIKFPLDDIPDNFKDYIYYLKQLDDFIKKMKKRREDQKERIE